MKFRRTHEKPDGIDYVVKLRSGLISPLPSISKCRIQVKVGLWWITIKKYYICEKMY